MRLGDFGVAVTRAYSERVSGGTIGSPVRLRLYVSTLFLGCSLLFGAVGSATAEDDAPSLLWPVVGKSAIAGFGAAGVGPQDGIDIKGPPGAPVLAVRDGKVRILPVAEGGSLVVIDSGESISSYRPVIDSELSDGDEIAQGTPIGIVADSGVIHFRFQRRVESGRLVPTDPVPLLASRHSTERAVRLGAPLREAPDSELAKAPSPESAAAQDDPVGAVSGDDASSARTDRGPAQQAAPDRNEREEQYARQGGTVPARSQEPRAALGPPTAAAGQVAAEIVPRAADPAAAPGAVQATAGQTAVGPSAGASSTGAAATGAAPTTGASLTGALQQRDGGSAAQEPAWRTVSQQQLPSGNAIIEQSGDRMRLRIVQGSKTALTEEARRIMLSDSKLLKKSQLPARDRNLLAVATFADTTDRAMISVYELTPTFKRRVQIATTLTGPPQLEDRNSDGTVEVIARVPVPGCSGPEGEPAAAVKPLELVYRISPRPQLSLRMSEPYAISPADLKSLAAELRPKIQPTQEASVRTRALGTIVRTAFYLARVDRRGDAIRFLGDTIGTAKDEKLRARMISCVLSSDERSRFGSETGAQAEAARPRPAARTRARSGR